MNLTDEQRDELDSAMKLVHAIRMTSKDEAQKRIAHNCERDLRTLLLKDEDR